MLYRRPNGKYQGPEPARRMDSIAGQGKVLFSVTKSEDLEDIVAKRMDSPYRFGERSPSWKKFKCLHEVGGVIGGYILKPDGMRTCSSGYGMARRCYISGKHHQVQLRVRLQPNHRNRMRLGAAHIADPRALYGIHRRGFHARARYHQIASVDDIVALIFEQIY